MADDFTVDGAIAETIALLKYYGFDLENSDATVVVDHWQTMYSATWLRMAVLEALYRGRYKQISVEEILRSWQKWDRVRCNFDLEFESLICAKLEEPVIPVANHVPEDNQVSQTEFNQSPNDAYSAPLTPAVPETYKKLKAIATEQVQILAEDQEESAVD